MTLNITKASENIFEDLGFDRQEAASLKLRSRLILRIATHLKSTGKTQEAIGALLGVGQSRVSDLLSQKVSQFSLDMLVNFAQKAGFEVEAALRTGEDHQGSVQH